MIIIRGMRFGSAVLLAALALDTSAQATNILIFIADDQGEGDLSAYGHPVLRTPNMDRLAREGMRFDNAFLTISSCSPSRSSILTGRYPHSTGAEDLHMPLPADQRTIARRLRNEGYHNLSVGKWHLGEEERRHWDVVVDCPGRETAEQAVQALAERPKDRPFFFWGASKDPHRPFDEGAIAKPHDPDEVVVPPYLPDHPLIRRDLALYYDEVTRFDAHVGEILAELERQEALDETLIVYVSDNGMPFPRAKTTLYDSGIRTPLIVRLPGAIPAGSVQKGLFSIVDLAPTLLDMAGFDLESAQGRSRAVMLRDPEAQGRGAIYAEANWHDFEQFTRAVRTERFLLVRNYYWQRPLWNSVDSINSITWTGYLAAQRAGRLTAAQELLFREPRPYEELYDLQVDPMSLRSVAAKPRYRTALNRLRSMLDNWRVETDDVMPARPRRDGWTKDGVPLPHNQPWYERYIEAGGRSSFEKF